MSQSLPNSLDVQKRSKNVADPEECMDSGSVMPFSWKAEHKPRRFLKCNEPEE